MITSEKIIEMIKDYEAETRNYFSYMQTITNTLINNPSYIMEIKVRLKSDLILKKRIIELGNSSNGQILQKLFKNLFEEKGKIK